MRRIFARAAVLLSLGVTFVPACSQDGPTTIEDIGIDADVAADVPRDSDSDTSEVGAAVCGDERIDAPYEQCEPSIPVSCADADFAFGTATCTDTCRIDTSACDGAPICGDGSVDGDESCDDGNNVDGDGCSADCTQDQCGDGFTTGDEECDGDRTTVCADGSLGVLPCSDDCTLQATSCLAEGLCGDGELNAGEACDDGNDVDADGCDTNCVPTACGNGVVEGAELCDGDYLRRPELYVARLHVGNALLLRRVPARYRALRYRRLWRRPNQRRRSMRRRQSRLGRWVLAGLYRCRSAAMG